MQYLFRPCVWVVIILHFFIYMYDLGWITVGGKRYETSAILLL